MRKQYFAICDKEKEYAVNFSDYMIAQKSIGYDFVCFDNVEDLLEFNDYHQLSILLIEENLVDERVLELDAKIFYLTESTMLLNDDFIFKYQSIRDIIKKISVASNGNLVRKSGKNLLLGDCKLIGIYSPLGRSGKSLLSVAMSEILSGDRPVLYISFEAGGGFDWMFAGEEELDITDLVYFIRQEDPELEKKIIQSIKQKSNFEYIPAAIAVSDIRSTDFKDVSTLIDRILALNKYSYIVMELDEVLGDMTMIMDECNYIFMPVLSDRMSEIKLKRFKELMKNRGEEGILNKTSELELPYYNGDFTLEDGIERIVWSELGEHVRNCIKEVL